jgi:hypothetical protein
MLTLYRCYDRGIFVAHQLINTGTQVPLVAFYRIQPWERVRMIFQELACVVDVCVV